MNSAVRPGGVAPRPGLAAGLSRTQRPERHDQPGLLGQRDERRPAGRGRAPGAASARAPRTRRSAPSRGRRSAGSGGGARRARAPRRRSVSRSSRSSVWRLIDGSKRAYAPGRVAPWPGPSRSRPRGAAPRASPGPAGRARSRCSALMNHSRPPSRERRARAPRRSARRSGAPRRALGDLVEQDAELVAAEAGDRVARAQAGGQPLADRDAAAGRRRCGRALSLIDLEAVEVEQDHGDRARRRPAATTREGVGDPVGQQLAVGQARWSGRTARRAAPRRSSRALSRAIEASWAKLVSASISRVAPACARVAPEARPSTPTTRPAEVSGTPTTAPNVPRGRSSARSGPGVVVVDGERLRRSGRPGRPARDRSACDSRRSRRRRPVPWRTISASSPGSAR